MAEHQLAHWHEGRAQGSFRRRPCAHSGWTTTANSGQGPATSARRGGLAHRRTQDVGREETLSRQPAGKDGPAHLGGHHQGAMDLRAGSPAAERRLGLDHFEGRSWQGLHRHALMTMIAYAFLQHRRLATARREKKNQLTAAPANFSSRTPRHPRTLRSTNAAAMPALSKMDLQRAAA